MDSDFGPPGKTSPDSPASPDLRKRAEEKAGRRRSWRAIHEPEKLTTMEIRAIIDELGVHQIELQMQNEELRKVHLEMEASRAQYFDLYDLAPVGYLVLSDKGLVIEANLKARGLLGFARGSLVGRPITQFILGEDHDLYYLNHKRLVETGLFQAFELRMVKKDGSAGWVRLESNAVQKKNGAPTFLLTMSDITDRRFAEGKVESLLAEKGLLLKEVHHRIKNNMSSIKSLLSMQADAAKETAVKMALEDACSRVGSMMVMYDRLFLSEDLRGVSAVVYFPDLTDAIWKALPGLAGIDLKLRCDDITLFADMLFPLGIITNELTSNAAKHAFPAGGGGTIRLDFKADPDGKCVLSIADDGAGIAETERPGASGQGFGLTLVKGLTEQLGGAMEHRHGRDSVMGKGVEFAISFAMKDRYRGRQQHEKDTHRRG